MSQALCLKEKENNISFNFLTELEGLHFHIFQMGKCRFIKRLSTLSKVIQMGRARLQPQNHVTSKLVHIPSLALSRINNAYYNIQEEIIIKCNSVVMKSFI